MGWFELALMIIGFSVASYAIVGNDAIQTLGTFIASNEKRPWWVLWLFSSSILAVVLMWGWAANGGDPAFGRLDKYPLPQPFTWLYLLPPVVLLVLTRAGIPVSTSFLILTVFQVSNLPKMLMTSMLGYLIAFVAAVVVYLAISKVVEKRFIDTRHASPSTLWVVLQWTSTGFLWSMWLIQDLANIFVYLPRRLAFGEIVLSLLMMVAVQAYIFYTRGGAVQKIVSSKTNTQDIRSATIIDFLFGGVLLLFKDGLINFLIFGVYEKIPMSTTWVFLGLLAGRELAMNVHFNLRSWRDLGGTVGRDAFKAGLGLAASVLIAVLLPYLTAFVPESAASVPAAVEAPERGTEHHSPSDGAESTHPSVTPSMPAPPAPLVGPVTHAALVVR
jgi:hypothetical protein